MVLRKLFFPIGEFCDNGFTVCAVSDLGAVFPLSSAHSISSSWKEEEDGSGICPKQHRTHTGAGFGGFQLFSLKSHCLSQTRPLMGRVPPSSPPPPPRGGTNTMTRESRAKRKEMCLLDVEKEVMEISDIFSVSAFSISSCTSVQDG